MIEIKRWFWNDKEVTKEEYDELDIAWKKTVEESEKNQESTDKPKRKKKWIPCGTTWKIFLLTLVPVMVFAIKEETVTVIVLLSVTVLYNSIVLQVP